MFDLVPFARSRPEVTDLECQPGVIGQALQGQFPEARSRAVAAAGVGRDQECAGAGEPVPAMRAHHWRIALAASSAVS
jgi:hypothetical protein